MKKLATTLILSLFFFPLFSQISAVTESGKSVVLNDDGTWNYKKVEINSDCNFNIKETNKKSLKREKIGESGTFALTGFLGLVSDSLLFSCSYEGDLGHVDHFSYATIKFEDNSTIELKGLQRTDHRTPPVFKAQIFDPYIIKNKKAIKIKLFLSEGFADIILSDKEFFMKSMECLE